MKFRFLTISLITFLVLYSGNKIIKDVYFFEEINFAPHKSKTNKNNLKAEKPKRILIVNSAHGLFGGAEMYTLSLYKNLIKKGHSVKVLLVKDSATEKKFTELKISHYSYNKYMPLKVTVQPGLYHAIYKICKENDIQIIHCNVHREVHAAQKAANQLNAKVVMTRHISDKLKEKYLKNLDGVIGVNKQITKYMQNENISKNLNVKELATITPFFEEKTFLNFKTQEKAHDFFQNNFNINLKNLPIICTIAHLSENKNHAVLFKAIHKLIYEKNKHAQIVLAGAENQNKLKKLSQDLNIQEYVHFLGYTEKIPEILHHSDIKVLPSKEEGFPISLLEAALLKKPLIGANKSGMTNLIKHEKTGLLFENNNVESLTAQIERLLDNPELGKQLGENAYEFVMNNFSTEVNMKKLEAFYERIQQH